MNYRYARWLCLPILSLLAATALPAQENQAKRLASIVGVAAEEYAKAIDEHGKLISKEEFDETYGFLADAKQVATRLNGYDAPATRAILDTMIAAVAKKQPPAVVRALHQRFANSLGTAGAMDLPERPLDAVEGETLYVKNCSSCHGMKGAGDGPVARTLTPPPPAIGITSLTPELTPTLAYNVISVGVRGTSMAGFAATLTPQQRWDVINYIYTLRGERLTVPVRADATAVRGDTASPVILALLDSALDFARSGKTAEAGDRAFDAYIAFEPLETPARAKKPGLVSTMERHFADFKGAVRRNDIVGAKNSRDAIADGLPSVVDLGQQVPSGSWEAFLQSFLIILREGFEAILVIGAVVALLIKTGHRERLRSIWIGIALGLVASAATAVAMKTLLAAMPASREIVEATSMLIAVVVLFSVSYWLISKVEGAKWQKFIREKVDSALEHGGGKALALVAFLAVYREGAETALFYQALFTEGANVGGSIALGIVAGFIVLAVIFTLFYRFGVRIPMRPFFTVTSILLYYMAFVFMGKGIRELQEGNIMPITVIPGGPHVDTMGIYPSLETLTAQGILIVLLLFATIRTLGPGHKAEEKPPEE